MQIVILSFGSLATLRLFLSGLSLMLLALAATGKHTLLLNKQAGLFVLGELFISLELPDDQPVAAHCGSCRACIDICPTQAIVGPHELNAAACISYLTIEHDGVIDVKYRRAIGNRVFGCDDCQLICPGIVMPSLQRLRTLPQGIN